MDSNNLAVPPPYNRLKFFNFSSLLNWSASAILVNRLDYRDDFKFVKIGKLIHRVKDTIKIQEDKEYQRVTIRVQGRGVTERDREIGKNIGTKNQFSVSAGQFIMSKIDARNGAFGIVPKELDGAAVTQDFLTYSFNKNLIVPEFFVLLTTTKQFYDLCQRASSGTTNRQRIDEQLFLNFEIPVPSLEEQMKLVEAYNQRISDAIKQENNAKKTEIEIEQYFCKILGIVLESEKQSKFKKIGKMTLLQYKDFSKWSLGFYFKKGYYNFDNIKYEFKTVKSIIKSFEGGKTPDKSNLEFWTNGTIHWTSPKDFNSMIVSNSEDKISSKALKDASMKIFESGTLLGVFRSGILRHSFPIAITTIPTTINQDLKAIQIDPLLVDKLYFLNYLKVFQKYVLERTSKVGVTVESINSDEFLELPIVLPPLPIQNVISGHIEMLREKVKTFKNQAENNRMKALETFENALFNKKP